MLFIDASLVDQSFYHYLVAHYELLQGNITEASCHTELILEKGKDIGFPLIECMYHLMKGHVLHALGDHEKAPYHLEQFCKIGRMMKSKPFKYIYLLTDAQFALDRGEDERGLVSLQKAMTFGREHRYTGAYIWLPRVMARLCSKALEAGIEIEYVRDLIKRHNILPETPQVEIESWPWRIRIFTLGRFTLVKDGKPVRLSRKGSTKTLCLLKALISMGGRDVREDLLADALWPETEGYAAHKAVITNIFRLRRLIGYEKMIYLHEGKMTLDPRYCYVDAWAFERILAKADHMIKAGYVDRSIKLIERAIGIYQGDFLTGDDDKDWASSMRERLKSKLLRYISKLGQLYEEKGELGKAIDIFRKGIEVDPLSEEFHQHIMTCYQRLGHRTEAVRIYQSLKKNLLLTLDMGPSHKTEVLYKTLILNS